MIKKTLIVLALFFSSLSIFALAEIWVAPGGSDQAPGTKAEPKASLHSALRLAREWRRLSDPSIADGIIIKMQSGTYFLDEPLLLRPEDSGTPESPTRIVAEKGKEVILSGGLRLGKWSKAGGRIQGLPAAAKGKVWVIDQPKVSGRYIDFRQLWVDDQKAVRARDTNDDNFKRILAWDKNTGVLTIPAPAVKSFKTLDRMELQLHQMWAVANLRIKSIEYQNENALLYFHQPESRIQAEHPWPTPMTKEGRESPYFLCNAIEFLDQPGEWYLDVDAHKLYYWPREGEVMNKAESVVPYLENLVDFQGSLDRPVKHLRFEGIGFSHTGWLRPSELGHVPLQAGMYLLDAYKLRPPGVPGNENRGLENQGWVGRPPAAVQLSGVQNTAFVRCRFEHLASCGIDYRYGSLNDSILACVFRDIGGNGIQAGKISDPGIETHLPYDPADQREICTKLYIGNNYIHDCSNEDWGCVGICAGYVRDILIEHNELSELSYSGISLGWGWTKTVNCMRNNVVRANYIHHYAKHMYDVAGIYTLSVQSKSLITENVIDSIYFPPYVHDPNHWFYLYTDEGSSFITVKDNWCPAEKFLQNANGPGNTWTNNGPMVDHKIRRAAGIKDEFSDIKP
ncbi:MAG: right-handed parallel beta-helix repeat-containing protein [Bacteroidales bacterium]|jgi:hypothetical protein|nr:right-handed parallel beta-helix repeat-containing protein [Bacteroidales bacterium]MDD4360972.1 right-handed parallel beta-helix repeat-containing protein [Bacteroidales bacterium]MDD4430757.1 right-handed parallel beta-helix repeat-containing protein [Bacteroidales bacterium]